MSENALNRLWTVNVWVSDRKRSIEFYTEKLGFEVALQTEEFDWVELALPGGFTKISLVEPRKDSGEAYYKWATQNIGVFTGISFETEDIQKAYDELMAKGVKFSGPPDEAPWGGKMTTFVDPDGNEFQLVEDKDHYKRKFK
jgi:catechol 2,3-dioxygenase-like lactoylglutathione lyase family enzyme